MSFAIPASRYTRRPLGAAVHVEFPISGAAAMRERAELRDRIAVANSLVPLLQPGSVAVVGASRDPSRRRQHDLPRHPARAISVARFTRSTTRRPRFMACAPTPRSRICPARRIWWSIAVPAANVLEVAGEALRPGREGTSRRNVGFRRERAGRRGRGRRPSSSWFVLTAPRLIGPNCLGLMNTHPEVQPQRQSRPLDALLADGSAFFSHSAALGLVILTTPRSGAWAFRASCRRATGPTSPATTCCSSGRRIRRPTSPCSIWRRSVTRADSPGSLAESPIASRFSASRARAAAPERRRARPHRAPSGRARPTSRRCSTRPA